MTARRLMDHALTDHALTDHALTDHAPTRAHRRRRVLTAAHNSCTDMIRHARRLPGFERHQRHALGIGFPRDAHNLYQDCRMPDTKRRPQWRGERKAVLVRLPVEVADQLARAAEVSHSSVSETAGQLISAGLATQRPGRGMT